MAGFLLQSTVVYGQVSSIPGEPPESVSLRLGPLALAPAVTLSNLGWDSNVFNRREDQNPVGDFVLTVRPEVRGWLQLGRARVTGRGAFAYSYFLKHPHERSMDPSYEGRVDVPLARLVPYASAGWVDARERFGFEIDDRTRRHEENLAAGAVVRLGSRTSFDASAGRSRLEFTQTESVLDPLITNFYDHTSEWMSFTVRRELTPLTSLVVTAHGNRDRFDLDSVRDNDTFGFSSGLEFSPFALISGRAFVGWNRVELVAPGGTSFTGLVTSVDLGYTLLVSTRFTIQAQRDLSYSAIRGQQAFVLTGVKGSVVRRMGANWDIGVRTGRHRASYGLFDYVFTQAGDAAQSVGVGQDEEIITEYGGQLGYLLAPGMRVNFDVARASRRSTIDAGRQYNVMRAGLSVTYRF